MGLSDLSRHTFGITKNTLDLIEISPVTVSDIDSIQEVANSCGLSYWTAADYSNESERDDSIFIKANPNDGPCLGFIVGRLVPGIVREDTRDAEIYNIGVRPGNQDAGIGSRLMGAFLSECRNRGVHTVWLEVRAGNSPAIAFYKKHGFNVVTARRSFYRDPVEDAIVMKSIL